VAHTITACAVTRHGIMYNWASKQASISIRWDHST